jgi:membrane fusion protein (multidrug efflux system)
MKRDRLVRLITMTANSTSEVSTPPATAPNSPAAPGITPKHRRLLLVAGALLVAGLSAWGVRYWSHGRFVESTDDAYLEADQITVTSRVPGFVEAVYVRDNESVVAGQPLVKLDERDPRSRLEQALAQVDQAKASIAQSRSQIGQQQAQIAQLSAQLRASRSQADFSNEEVQRYSALVKAGAETHERYDQLRQNRDQSQAQVQRDAAALLAAQRLIGTYAAQIQQAEAQIEQYQAQARRAQVDLDATLLRASVNGRVADRTVRVGEYVQSGNRLMSVVPVENVYLVANFKETQIHRMRIGQAASVAVDALGGRRIEGTIESFSPGTGAQFALIPPNNATGNFTKIVQRVPVRIELRTAEDLRRSLIPGLSVTVSVDTAGVRK